MKKTAILTALTIMTAATVASAEPQFGIAAYTDGGAGLYMTDSMYSGSLTFASSDDDATAETKTTAIELDLNLKKPVDSQTAMTVGISYGMVSGDTNGQEIDSWTKLALTAGVEKEVADAWLLLASVDVYSTSAAELKNGTDTTTTNIFGGGRVGLAYLF